RPYVVLEAEGDVEYALGRLADARQRVVEARSGRLVGAGVLGRHDVVEGQVQVAQGVGDDVRVGVGDDDQAQPAFARLEPRRPGVGEGLPGAHRAHQGFAVPGAIGPAALAA